MTAYQIKKELEANGIICIHIPINKCWCEISLDNEKGGRLFYYTEDQLIEKGQRVLDLLNK